MSVEQHYVRRCVEALRRDDAVRAPFQVPGTPRSGAPGCGGHAGQVTCGQAAALPLAGLTALRTLRPPVICSAAGSW